VKTSILQALLAVQDRYSFVPADAIGRIAHDVRATPAEVAGVRSFYPGVRTGKPGRHVVRVCVGEGCVANHGGRLLRALEHALGVRAGETTPDGRVTLERVYCVGACAVGPNAMVDDAVVGRLTEADVPALLERLP